MVGFKDKFNFLPLLRTEAKSSKKELDQYLATLTKQAWLIQDLLHEHAQRKIFVLQENIRYNPKWVEQDYIVC